MATKGVWLSKKFMPLVFLVVYIGVELPLVSGHGAIVTPRSRNSVDYRVGINTQRCSNITGNSCLNGQASFFYSQGCFIGCPKCDHTSGRIQKDLCGLGKKATLNDARYRSVNRGVAAGSDLDIYKHNPWRAPGNAPVADPCGLAGGTPWGMNASEEGDYIPTKYASHGMRGSDLPKMPLGVEWKLGGSAEVTWQVRNNHGGGYQYRLCPASEVLTEDCFQRHPLKFFQDQQAIVFPNGTLTPIRGTFVNVGTQPKGSTWAMIPLPPTWLGPRCLPGPNDTNSTPNGCEAWEGGYHAIGPCKPCPMTPGSDCSRCGNTGHPEFHPPCPGCEGGHPGFPGEPGKPGSWVNYAVRDLVHVPSDMPAGNYVLGWRYDCEASAQVWSNCADVTLVK